MTTPQPKISPQTAPPPALSVVVVPLVGPDTLRRCLSALHRQVGAPAVEILVPFDARHPTLPVLQAHFPQVQFLPLAGQRTYAELRAAGVRRAAGHIIALTEDHCLPRPDWCAQLVSGHEADAAAVGGAVEKLHPDTALNWALYLADYVRYMNPAPAGPTHHLTDCNVSYKKTALAAIAPVWRTEFHEPEVHAALQAQGGALYLLPQVVVEQQRPVNPAQALRDRVIFGRLFGGGRAAGLPPARRGLMAGAALVLPLLLTARSAGHVVRKKRHRLALLRALPWLIALNTLWAWGELLGYVTGRAGPALTPQSPAQPEPVREI
jgi:hypothetical protein